MPSRSTETTVLGTILILGLAIRLWGIDFGLPHLNTRPDETGITVIALSFFSGDLNPHFFRYPSLYFYLLACIYGVFVAIRLLLGSTVDELITEIAVDPSNYVLISRAVSALFGTFTLLAVYNLGRVFVDRLTGIVAAALMAACYLHARESHFGLLDVTMTFWIVMASTWVLKTEKQPDARASLVGGLFTGLAASTKYAGIFLGFSMAIAWIGRAWQHGSRNIGCLFSEAYRSPVLRRFTIGAAIGFLAFTPFSLLDFSTFLSDIRAESKHLRTGHAGLTGEIGLIYHLRVSLYYGVGLPVLLAALVGVVSAWRSNPITTLTIMAFPIVYFVVAGAGRTVFVRYMVPLTPYLCLFAAVGVMDLARRWGRQSLVYVLALSAVISVPSLYRIYHANRLLAETDSRLIAAEWIQENIPEGHSIVQSGTDWARVEVPPSRTTLEARIEESRQRGRRGRRLQVQLDHTSPDAGYDLIQHSESNPVWDRDRLPDYAILQDSPFFVYASVSDAWTAWLSEHYVETHAIEGLTSEVAVYDHIDAQFLPYAGFGDETRPGPNITIYRRKDLE